MVHNIQVRYKDFNLSLFLTLRRFYLYFNFFESKSSFVTHEKNEDFFKSFST